MKPRTRVQAVTHPTDEQIALGNQRREARDNCQLSRVHVAEKTGISESTIFNYEHGHQLRPEYQSKLDDFYRQIGKKTPDSFTRWTGGPRPVDRFATVSLVLRDGTLLPAAPADLLSWEHSGGRGDITAYADISSRFSR